MYRVDFDKYDLFKSNQEENEIKTNINDINNRLDNFNESNNSLNDRLNVLEDRFNELPDITDYLDIQNQTSQEVKAEEVTEPEVVEVEESDTAESFESVKEDDEEVYTDKEIINE